MPRVSVRYTSRQLAAAFLSVVAIATLVSVPLAAAKTPVGPTVAIAAPADGLATNAGAHSVRVAFEASANPTGRAQGPTGNVTLVALLLDGVEVARYDNPPEVKEGNHTFVVDIADVPEGWHTFQAVGYQGNERADLTGESAPVEFLIDRTPPVVEIASPVEGFYAIDPTVTVEGTAEDALSGLGEVTCDNVTATVTVDAFACEVELIEGPNEVVVRALDVAGNEASDGVTVNYVPGGIPGPPDALAVDALFDEPPVAAPPEHIVNGIILSLLDVWLDPGATVAEVNDALALVDGRIDSMNAGIPVVTLIVPLQEDVEALQELADRLMERNSVVFAEVGRMKEPAEIPSPFILGNDYLIPTRFPAAWNARARAEDVCEGSGPVPVLVVDGFNPASVPEHFPSQVPNFTLIEPASSTAESTHGFKVTGAVTALFDDTTPTGANPLAECVDITGVNVDGLSHRQERQQISDHLPASRFVMNYSMGFGDQVRCGGQAVCASDDYTNQLVAPLQRALHAVHWKELTHARWQDFLLFAAAGNEADKPATVLYRGLGQAPYSGEMLIAANPDPLFGFIEDRSLWEPLGLPALPSLVTSDFDVTMLHAWIEQRGMEDVIADNVLSVGATTKGFDLLTGEVTSLEDLQEADFSDRNPDVKAVGESVSVAGGQFSNGTSYASPQLAGLASYLMLLDPSITPAQVKEAILANAKDNAHTTGILDAYDTVLSLDAAELPNAVNAPVRNAILDVNDDGIFTLADIGEFLDKYRDPVTGEPVSPEDKDYSRYDLNGDGFTGGPNTAAFDLDRVGSAQYGAPALDTIQQEIADQEVEFNEVALSDLEILCYYAYSDMFVGTEDDEDARDELLAGHCAPSEGITIEARVTQARTFFLTSGPDRCDSSTPVAHDRLPEDTAPPVALSASCPVGNFIEFEVLQPDEHTLSWVVSASNKDGGIDITGDVFGTFSFAEPGTLELTLFRGWGEYVTNARFGHVGWARWFLESRQVSSFLLKPDTPSEPLVHTVEITEPGTIRFGITLRAVDGGSSSCGIVPSPCKWVIGGGELARATFTPASEEP